MPDALLQRVIGKDAPPIGVTPSIVLINPKFGHNVGAVIRLASCYGFEQVWYTGDRLELAQGDKFIPGRSRLPREERMKAYEDVKLINFDYPFDQFPGAVPVGVEVRENAERLHEFEHPQNAVYVFGPEDGSLPQSVRSFCHRFAVIPTRHCLNLATAAATIMWDRELKAWLSGARTISTTPGEFEQRGLRL